MGRRYHHGDLANALVDAATALAREGGPDAVVLREVARSVGVSPTAAYRHFADHGALLTAVREQCQNALALAMRAQLNALGRHRDPRSAARGRLAAVGRGYLAFAFTEPGLFRTAFSPAGVVPPPSAAAPDDEAAVAAASPYELLSMALDGLVAEHDLPPARRPLAEIAAWAAVHGLAQLVLDGPLASLTDDERAAAVERTLSMVLRGL